MNSEANIPYVFFWSVVDLVEWSETLMNTNPSKYVCGKSRKLWVKCETCRKIDIDD